MIGSVVATGWTGASTPKYNHNDGDKRPQKQQKLSLRHEIRFASLVDQLGNFAHGAMDRQVLQLRIDRQTETQSENAEQDSNRKQKMPVPAAEESDTAEIGQLEVGFAADLFRLGQCGRHAQGYE